MRHFKQHGYDVVAWAFFVLVPVVILWQSATSLAEQGVASGGAMENAAIFPRIIAWIMIGLAAVNAFRILGGRLTHQTPITGTPTTGLALVSTGLFIAYLLIMPYAGYHLATPMLLAVLLRLYGLGWVGSIGAAVIMSLGVAAVFEGLLNVVLPVGALGITVFG